MDFYEIPSLRQATSRGHATRYQGWAAGEWPHAAEFARLEPERCLDPVFQFPMDADPGELVDAMGQLLSAEFQITR